jgi:hypothetical protein
MNTYLHGPRPEPKDRWNELAAFWNAVALSPLEHFSIGMFEEDCTAYTLCWAIPQFRMPSLDLNFEDEIYLFLSQDIFKAVKVNSCLCKVKASKHSWACTPAATFTCKLLL